MYNVKHSYLHIGCLISYEIYCGFAIVSEAIFLIFYRLTQRTSCESLLSYKASYFSKYSSIKFCEFFKFIELTSKGIIEFPRCVS